MAASPHEPEAALPVISSQSYRDVLGRYATGVSVITTVQNGMDHAMTANSFTSVSLDPPLVLVCVEHDTRFHESVQQMRLWGVSILSMAGRPRARWFASSSRPLEGQFASVPHRRGALTGAALLLESVATLECETYAMYEAGDHDIVVGRVLDLAVDEVHTDPLLYWHRGYHELGPQSGY
jgi:flavin reductase (DIM6/NTAB) family NADH-FMN oxidoreductase RutF